MAVDIEKPELARDDSVQIENAHGKAVERAKAATDKEHRMGLLEGIRTYNLTTCISKRAHIDHRLLFQLPQSHRLVHVDLAMYCHGSI
jgi:hypothetical protein